MRYMCNGHRQWLIDNPSELTPSWQRATSMGCEAMLVEHWQRAAICFGNAVEVAELELARTPDQAAQQRYLEAAAQMMAAFRRLGDQRSCRFLFSRVLELLERLSMRDFCEESLGILKEFTFGDSRDAEKLMWQKLASTKERRTSLH